MEVLRRKRSTEICSLLMISFYAIPNNVFAYVDPGTTGMLSQLLYVMFYGLLAVFLYSLRYIKQIMANLRRYLFKSFPEKKK